MNIGKHLNTEEAIEKLDSWLTKNGWAGYDPYDLKALPFTIYMANKSTSGKLFIPIRELIYELFYTFPLFFRKLFRVKKQVNPKAMGLFATAYLDLYKKTNEEVYLKKSEECINWLLANANSSMAGKGWGYPFDWQSTQFIKKNTPNGIVTTAVGEAFWEHYKHSGNQDLLNVCIDICKFLMNLPIDTINEQQVCFSYTPLFTNHVHNLNLFVAEYLMKVGLEIKNDQFVNLARKAVNYTVEHQNPDGSFFYYGPPDKPGLIDNYHTGFVLRMLYSIWELTDDKQVYYATQIGYEYYIQNFFQNKRIPKFTPERLYRLDIHSCAESIICITTLSKTFSFGKEIAENVLQWTVEQLQDKKGFFYYGILKSRFTGMKFKSKIPYIRWGQAWMLRALTTYYTSKHAG